MAGKLILILRDFFATEGGPADAMPDGVRPRLPALETLLATARSRALECGWREDLAAGFAAASVAGESPASIAAKAWLEPFSAAPARFWLATPVHYFAGLDSVQLHPSGLLDLPLETQAALASDFNAVFADSPWRLYASGRRELLLAGPALEAGGEDPARFLGCKLETEQARDAGGIELRRLAVEIEMWLHEHALNLQRQARGELPVSGLWFWGSQPLTRVARRARLEAACVDARLYGEDTFAEALWRLLAGTRLPLPARLAVALEAAVELHVVLYPTAGARGAGDALEHLEQDWLSPALAALRAGSLTAVELLAGSHAYRLRRLDLARFWRARAPWREALA
jgi:hypothetical protein